MIALNQPDSNTDNLPPVGPKDQSGDTYLWLSFKSGNELAFSSIYKNNIQLLYNYGMNHCRDKDLVMDCLQELFARLWDKRATVGEVKSVKAYLIASFSRLLHKKRKEQHKSLLQGNFDDARFFELVPSHEREILDDEQAAEASKQLQHCMKGLSRRQREALFLKFNNNLSYEEIATVMEMQVESTYNIISKALQRLRETLKRSSIFYS